MLAALRAMVRSLDARLLSSAEAVELVDYFAEIERLGHAGKTLAAGRAAEGDAWKRAGDRSPADWLARRTGSSVGRSRAALDTASKLGSAPAADAALRAGELSADQAAAIAPAAAADPSAEPRLLEIAKHQSLQKLRDECDRVRAAAEPDPKARHDRIHKERFWKRWTRRDGSRAGLYAGTPEQVALIEAAAQPFLDARIDAARRDGAHEPSEAYAFDGLTAMARSTMATRTAPAPSPAPAHEADGPAGGVDTASPPSGNLPPDPTGDGGPGSAASPPGNVRAARGGRGRKRLSERRELFLVADLAAWRRGFLQTGETCEIPGIGPVSIDAARELFGDALLRIVLRHGVDIRTVVHAGRTANALQETAVLVQQHGRCARPGCSLPISEIDHTIDYSTSGITTLDQLVGVCGHDHDLKTRHHHTYHREHDGTITWIRPDGTEEHERPPPPPDTS